MFFRLSLILAAAGHILCGIADCLLTYTPNGRFRFGVMKQPEEMARLFGQMPLKNLVVSIVLGAASLAASSFGYLALYGWLGQFSPVYAGIMYAGVMFYLVFGAAHHVICGTAEWFYVRMGRTGDALDMVREYFKGTAVTMYLCYIGLLIFAAAFFTAVLTGHTPLPAWACLCNTLPLALVLAPTKAPAKGNIAGALMFLGLLFLV